MTQLLRHISLIVLCALAATTASALELAPYPKVLKSPDGMTVTLAPSADGAQALLQVTGINHAIDQVVFLTTRESQDTSRDIYFTTIDGRRHNLLHREAARYGGGDRYTAYLPGQRKADVLGYSEDDSKALKPAALKARFEEQVRGGVQENLARFDRPKAMARAQARVDEADQAAEEACGTPIKTTLRWSTIDDPKLQKLSIGSFCSAVAGELATMCSNEPAFKTTAQQLGQVQCQFGPALKLRQENSQLVFTTQANAPNQGDFVRQFLRNQ